MKNADWPVTKDDVGPNGPGGTCFYCRETLGSQHKEDCVIRTQTVLVEVKLDLVCEVPEDWDEEMVNFHMNDSSWCADNIVGDINSTIERLTRAGKCLCSHFEGRYIREATEEDETNLGITPRSTRSRID